MKFFTFLLISALAILSLAACTARSDETTPEMAQNMLKLRGFNFTEPQFFRAIRGNDGIAVKGFLQGGINPNAKNEAGETALTFALQHADSPLIKVLIDRADINMRDDLGNSPIHLALKKNEDIFKLLLEKNADVNVPGRIDSKTNDQTVLYVAVARADMNLVKTLLDRGADPNKPDDRGSLPLVEAVVDSDADPEIVKLMIDKGAEVNKQETENNAHALIFIAQNKSVSSGTRRQIVEMLLAKGADRSIKDSEGKTALDWAKERNHAELFELLKK